VEVREETGTGETEIGPYLTGIGGLESVDYWLFRSGPINDLLSLSSLQAKGKLPIANIAKRSILGQAIDNVLASINRYNYRIASLIDEVNFG